MRQSLKIILEKQRNKKEIWYKQRKILLKILHKIIKIQNRSFKKSRVLRPKNTPRKEI